MTLNRFALTAVTAGLLASAVAQASPLQGLSWESRQNYFTTQPSTPAGAGNTPYNMRHRPTYGGALSGAPLLRFNEDPITTFGTSCSGALYTRFHIITAAHCVTNANGVMDVDLVNTNNYVLFPALPNANAFTGALVQVNVSAIIVHPGWNGDYLFNGNDIAIIRLAGAAPDEVPDYDIYTASDEVGDVGTKVGWGLFGLGSNGIPISSGWRTGQNIWDMDAKTFWDGLLPASDSIMMYDFDNGLGANDAFGTYFGVNDLGLGDMEVMSAQGDSGGPTFIDGKIAGITSFGLTFTDGDDGQGNPTCLPQNPDLVCGLDNTFGEFGGDTRVSAFADWIRANTVPVPATVPMLALGLLLLPVFRSRSDHRRSS